MILKVDFAENEKTIPVGFEESGGVFEPDFGEIHEVTTNDHNKLMNKNAADQHPIEAITGLEAALTEVMKPATAETLGRIKVGENLKITEEGVLSVDTTDNVDMDNTKPITAAAVATQVGNIEILLSTI